MRAGDRVTVLTPHAKDLLESWDESVRHFWRVAPRAEAAELENAHEASR